MNEISRKDKELEVDKVCPDCNGEGKGTIDYHDPSSSHGHGQYESTCGTCEGKGRVEIDEEEAENRAGIRKIWESARKQMTIPTQERVKTRVLHDWELAHAIKSEGIIVVRRSVDTSKAKEMFETGDLTIERERPEKKAQDITPEAAKVLGIETPQGETQVETPVQEQDCGVSDPKVLCRQPFCVSCKGKDRFVPRPKSGQQP